MSNQQVEVDILAELKLFSDQNTVDVYIPSIKQTVQIKKFTVKQQKSLLLVALDDAKSLVNFNISLYDIIYENLLDKNIELTIFDKNSIVFGLLNSDIPDGKPNIYSKIVEKYKTTDLDISELVITNKNIQFTLDVPTFQRDYTYNKTLLTKYNADIQNKREFIEHTYLIEIAKYIKTIDITKNGKQKVTTLLHEQKLDTILKIVDCLPSVNQIINYMSNVKTLEKTLNTVDGETVDISPSLFI